MRLGKLHIHRRHMPHIAVGIGTLVLFFGMLGPLIWGSSAHAALVSMRSVQLSDPTASATNVNYKFSFTTATAGSIGSITFEICSNYLFDPSYVCNPPTGFSAASAVLSSQSGITDFSINSSSTASKIILSRPASTVVSPEPLQLEFGNITNPSNIGSYYVHIATFASTDGSGPELDYGNVVFAINNDINITTEVPPYLMFCVGITIDGYNCGTANGGQIDFGELSTTATRSATSQMLASTNADYGYSITLAGTTMTAGNNVIPALTGQASRIGTSQFGLNARENTIPLVGADPNGPGTVVPTANYNVPNQYRFVSGDIITSTNAPDDYRKLTVSYIVNRGVGQPPGRYVATVSYICLANF